MPRILFQVLEDHDHPWIKACQAVRVTPTVSSYDPFLLFTYLFVPNQETKLPQFSIYLAKY